MEVLATAQMHKNNLLTIGTDLGKCEIKD